MREFMRELVYVGKNRGEYLQHSKYIKKIMGSNGRWRYIYDAAELGGGGIKKTIKNEAGKALVKKRYQIKQKIRKPLSNVSGAAHKVKRSVYLNAGGRYKEAAKDRARLASTARGETAGYKKASKAAERSGRTVDAHNYKMIAERKEQDAKLYGERSREYRRAYDKSLAGRAEKFSKKASKNVKVTKQKVSNTAKKVKNKIKR